jgi:transposase
LGIQARNVAPVRVCRYALVRDWLAKRRDQIEVFYLPAYSPDLNPDEGLNGDLKQAVTAKPLARSKAQLKRTAINHLRKLSKSPARIRTYFLNPQFRYAA